ncbi:UNVERIFIED_CONTAM: hypothetical protein K2H54_063439 [Gekko kuhli]
MSFYVGPTILHLCQSQLSERSPASSGNAALPPLFLFLCGLVSWNTLMLPLSFPSNPPSRADFSGNAVPHVYPCLYLVPFFSLASLCQISDCILRAKTFPLLFHKVACTLMSMCGLSAIKSLPTYGACNVFTVTELLH